MGKHHTSKAGRTHGKYRERLNRRGLSKAPMMPDLRSLRGRQGASSEDWDKLPEREKF